MGDREPNSYVRSGTCNAKHDANNQEHKDMKKDIEKLDSRIWWIVGTAVLTFLMQVYITLKT
jgi:hypothetical protein